MASAERLKPFSMFRPSGEVCVAVVTVFGLEATSWAMGSGATGWGLGGGSSWMGDGRGGGMSVPSVREPNLRSSAGSWNLEVVVPVAEPLL